jgi:hypothetical protein
MEMVVARLHVSSAFSVSSLLDHYSDISLFFFLLL